MDYRGIGPTLRAHYGRMTTIFLNPTANIRFASKDTLSRIAEYPARLTFLSLDTILVYSLVSITLFRSFAIFDYFTGLYNYFKNDCGEKCDRRMKTSKLDGPVTRPLNIPHNPSPKIFA